MRVRTRHTSTHIPWPLAIIFGPMYALTVVAFAIATVAIKLFVGALMLLAKGLAGAVPALIALGGAAVHAVQEMAPEQRRITAWSAGGLAGAIVLLMLAASCSGGSAVPAPVPPVAAPVAAPTPPPAAAYVPPVTTTTEPAPTTTTEPAPTVQSTPAPAAATYRSCAAARAAGAAPLYRGQSGYSASLDRDSDGVACEVTTK